MAKIASPINNPAFAWSFVSDKFNSVMYDYEKSFFARTSDRYNAVKSVSSEFYANWSGPLNLHSDCFNEFESSYTSRSFNYSWSSPL